MKKNNFKSSKGVTKIYVCLNDWCPACIEYKVILNMVMAKQKLEIDFSIPSNISINVIPTTIFVKDKSFYRLEGFMTYNKFMDIYKEIVNKDVNKSPTK